jgi:hypothetical protein
MVNYKQEVLGFFDNYVFPYLIGDLRKLQMIKADEKGEGACAVPQAITAFTACDLMGFLIDIQEPKSNLIRMRMMPFLKHPNFLPEIHQSGYFDEFINSIKDDFRSVMVHRFFPVKFDIGKLPEEEIIVNNGKLVFNVSYFTTIVIKGIGRLYDSIKDDTYIFNDSEINTVAIKRLYERIEILKTYESKDLPVVESLYPVSSTTTSTAETTSSLG